jgi:diguanylate cyclase (GGDEF)-like protein/PAS domain S-box-containing protein
MKNSGIREGDATALHDSGQPAQSAPSTGYDSEADVAKLFAAAPVGMSEISPDGHFVRANAMLCRMLDRPLGEVLQLTIPDATHPEDLPRSIEAVRRLLATGDSMALDKRFIRRDGSFLWVNTILTRIDDVQGLPRGILAVTVDLTERKRSEAALLDSEERYRALADLSPDGIFIITGGTLAYVNDASVELLRADSRKQLIGRVLTDFLPPEFHDGTQQRLDRLAGEISNPRVEIVLRRFDGSEVDVEVAAGNVTWKGQPAIQALLRDVSERKRNEIALRRSEASLAFELQAMTWLHELSTRLFSRHDLPGALGEVLEAALDMLGAGMGHVALYDPTEQNLHIAAQRGFSRELVERVRLDEDLACMRAMTLRQRVLIEDVYRDSTYHRYHRLAAVVGYRALVVLPLIGHNDDLLGVMSLHFRQPHRPSEHDLRMLDLYAHRAIDFLERMRSEQALAENEARFRALAEASPTLIWQVDTHGAVVYMNPRFSALTGIASAELLGDGWRALLHPDDAPGYLQALAEAQQARTMMHKRVRLHSNGGGWRWLESYAAPWLTADGRYAGHVGTSIDISDEVQAQEKLSISNDRLKLAIEGAGDGVWDWNVRTGNVVSSPRLNSMLGLPQHEDVTSYGEWERLVHPDDLPQVVALLKACLGGVTSSFRSEHRMRYKNSGWIWVLSRGIVVARDARGQALRMAGTISDISEKRRSEDVIWRHANFDTLTGLPNRRLFRDRLDQAVKKAHRVGLPVALLFIDLDRFKEANDLLGHDVGDLLLIEAARRISACVRQSDTVARLGGDEFTAILQELDDSAHVDVVAQKLIDALAAPFRLGNEVIYLSASIGVTLYPTDASGAEEMIRNADQAMYAAKNAGKNQFNYFTRSMQQEAHTRLRLIADLRNALSGDQFKVYYQPVIDLFSGRVVKAEALLRWMHPKLGLIDPPRFIPFAEESGLINEIGDWVFRQAADCSRHWGERLGAPFQISVNKSPVQFLPRPDERSWVSQLDEMGLTGGSISVEITEGLLLNASSSVVERLLQYRDAGIQVAIDDFGTGYSSMAYLRKFDIDYLKIDQSFVRDMASDAGDRAIVRSIIAMAHELGLQVIAEGIETQEQRDSLIEAGCDFGQGFLFSKAVPADQFERVLYS